MNLSSHESNHYACQEAELLTFKHYINKIKIINAVRVVSKPCEFLKKLGSYMYISSIFLNHVNFILRNDYDIERLYDNDKDAILARIVFKQNHERQMRVTW